MSPASRGLTATVIPSLPAGDESGPRPGNWPFPGWPSAAAAEMALDQARGIVAASPQGGQHPPEVETVMVDAE